MAQTQHLSAPRVRERSQQQGGREQQGPLRRFMQERLPALGGTNGRHAPRQNVSEGERMVSAAAGAILAGLGLGRRDLTGLAIAGVGGALIYRGATGHCSMYQSLGVDTTREQGPNRSQAATGVHITQSFQIHKSAEELYSFWRNFENFPRFMEHLESVRNLDDRRSHWVAKAPKIYGGQVEWDAEITTDDPNRRIAWRALPGSDVQHSGEVRFEKAPGDRGTNVRIELQYHPPAGQIGRWLAKLFGEEPEIQVREDVRRFKRLMEIGEVPKIDGQPRGTCTGQGTRS
jgi:uncharacterized membrane protein